MRLPVRALAALLPLALAPAALGQQGKTTLEQTIVGGDPAEAFQFLRVGPGEPYAVLSDLAEPKPGRERRRVSLAYFGHLSDFQLADEESPARVEFLDPDPSGTASSAWRPQEALQVAPGGRVDPRDEPVSVESRAAAWRHARTDGERRADGRSRRQHAAQRDRVGRAAARGRHARPEQRHRRPLRKLLPAGHAARRPRGLHRRTGLRRLLRVGFASTTPTPRPGSTRTGPRIRASWTARRRRSRPRG